MNSQLCLAAMVLLTGICKDAQGQQVPESPKPPAFPKLFPFPSGKNGYEEIVLASDEVRNFVELDKLAGPGAKLTDRRQAVSDPRCSKAIRLLRLAVEKPLDLPKREMTFDTELPELSQFRRLGRLMSISMYVQFANGQVSAGLDEFDLALKLAFVSKRGTMIHELVGTAINAILLARVSQHLDQFSARDCDRLLALAKKWLAMPDPTAGTLSQERDVILKELERAAANPEQLDKFLASVAPADGDEASARQAQALRQQALANPALLKSILSEASQTLKTHYDSAISQAGLPPSRRRNSDQEIVPRTPGEHLAAILMPANQQFLNRTARGRVQFQLLAIHAAIHRHRWEHEALPGTLDALKLGELVLDPFTDKPFQYKTDGKTYELSSPGAGGDDRPITLGRPDRP